MLNLTASSSHPPRSLILCSQPSPAQLAGGWVDGKSARNEGQLSRLSSLRHLITDLCHADARQTDTKTPNISQKAMPSLSQQKQKTNL